MSVNNRKGIVLAGGTGSRLHPLTLSVSKQLMPVYDKPMIYYPLATLMLGGITEVLIITTPHEQESFQKLLGDGTDWGMRFSYAVQPEPKGLAQALIIGEEFLAGEPSVLILGDNIFYGQGFPELLSEASSNESGATVFAYHVSDPERYGVVEFDRDRNVLSIEEKPSKPRSQFAVTGLYFYDDTASAKARSLKPSQRGELEITDLNRLYLEEATLSVKLMGRGTAWLDTGTHESLLEAASYIETIEKRQGLKISCPEEIAYRYGLIDDTQMRALADRYRNNGYGDYLKRVLEFNIDNAS